MAEYLGALDDGQNGVAWIRADTDDKAGVRARREKDPDFWDDIYAMIMSENTEARILVIAQILQRGERHIPETLKTRLQAKFGNERDWFVGIKNTEDVGKLLSKWA